MSETAHPTHHLDTPEAAEAAFYRAFSQGDLDAMMAVWKPDDSVVCLHPGDRRREGFEAVRHSWSEVLEPGVGRFAVTPADVLQTRSGDLCVHTLRELLWVDGELRGVMLATNVYVRTDAGWRL